MINKVSTNPPTTQHQPRKRLALMWLIQTLFNLEAHVRLCSRSSIDSYEAFRHQYDCMQLTAHAVSIRRAMVLFQQLSSNSITLQVRYVGSAKQSIISPKSETLARCLAWAEMVAKLLQNAGEHVLTFVQHPSRGCRGYLTIASLL